MKYLALFVPFLILLPSSAFAAELSLKSQDDRMLSVRYEDMEGATLSVVSKAGEKVRRDMRLQRESGTKRVLLPKDMPAGAYTLRATDRSGAELGSASFTVTYPAPTCTLRASEKTLQKGDLLRLRWSSENATSALLFGGKKVDANGRERVSVHHAGDRGFALNLIGPGGIGSCSVTVKVTE